MSPRRGKYLGATGRYLIVNGALLGHRLLYSKVKGVLYCCTGAEWPRILRCNEVGVPGTEDEGVQWVWPVFVWFG